MGSHEADSHLRSRRVFAVNATCRAVQRAREREPRLAVPSRKFPKNLFFTSRTLALTRWRTHDPLPKRPREEPINRRRTRSNPINDKNDRIAPCIFEMRLEETRSVARSIDEPVRREDPDHRNAVSGRLWLIGCYRFSISEMFALTRWPTSGAVVTRPSTPINDKTTGFALCTAHTPFCVTKPESLLRQSPDPSHPTVLSLIGLIAVEPRHSVATSAAGIVARKSSRNRGM